MIICKKSKPEIIQKALKVEASRIDKDEKGVDEDFRQIA